MSSNSSPVLTLKLQAWPRWLPMGALLLSACCAPLLADLSITWSTWLIAIAAIGTVVWAMRTPTQRALSVSWRQDHSWVIQHAGAEPRYMRLLAHSWSSPWLMCLRFEDISASHIGRFTGRLDLLIWSFEVPAALWHALRLRLRLEGQLATQTPIRP